MVIASSKPKILITGIEGFTGQYLARVMESRGYEVFGTAHNINDASGRIANVDLRDHEAVKHVVHDVRPDAVAHLAAIAYVADRNVAGMYHTNLLGSFNLLDALGSLESHKPHSILMASSATVYGNNAIDVISEEVRPDPNNDYAVSKYAMEKMAKLWMQKLPIVIVRPFNYTGIGQTAQFLIPKIVQHFIEKQPVIELGNLDVWREFGDVRFVAEVYGKLLDKCPVGSTVNVCTGKAYSLREVIGMCETITGHKIDVRVNPEFVRANEVRMLQGDNKLMTSIVGNSLAPGLDETLAWMLNAR